jgi:hypothetical protein
MPLLKNPRRERFAQALASGKSAIEAHRMAGYKADTKLQRDPRISLRVGELLEQRRKIAEKGTERAFERIVERSAITKQSVIEMLLADRELARENKQASAAIAAAKLIGSELFSMFVERKEQGRPGDFAGLSDAELEERLMATLIDRGLSEEQARILVARQRVRGEMLDPTGRKKPPRQMIDVTPTAAEAAKDAAE